MLERTRSCSCRASAPHQVRGQLHLRGRPERFRRGMLKITPNSTLKATNSSWFVPLPPLGRTCGRHLVLLVGAGPITLARRRSVGLGPLAVLHARQGLIALRY